MSKYYNIGEAAEFIGVSEETLRRWDKTGKFIPQRHPINNYRVYSEEQLRILFSDIQESIPTLKDDTNIKVPFFQTKNGTLYNCDSLDLMSKMDSESIDLIFADPPYNIKKAEWDVFNSNDDYLSWTYEWVKQAQRILKKDGSIYICGFSETLADIKYTVKDLFQGGCRWLIWYYRNKANLGSDWGRSHESILHFRKSKKHIFNIDEVRIPYNEHTLKYPKRSQAATSQYNNKNKYEWEPNPKGAKPKDVLEIPTISNSSWERYPHETQKPVELLRKIILSSSNQDSIILDPFGGSGTTYAVAEAYNRRWIGIEREQKYCNIIKERLSDRQHLSQIISIDEDKINERRQSLRM